MPARNFTTKIKVARSYQTILQKAHVRSVGAPCAKTHKPKMRKRAANLILVDMAAGKRNYARSAAMAVCVGMSTPDFGF